MRWTFIPPKTSDAAACSDPRLTTRFLTLERSACTHTVCCVRHTKKKRKKKKKAGQKLLMDADMFNLTRTHLRDTLEGQRVEPKQLAR